MALSELVTYIVETSLSSDGPSAFRLADMCNMYQQRLDQLTNKKKVPSNWRNFLRPNDNKTDLLHFMRKRRAASLYMPNMPQKRAANP